MGGGGAEVAPRTAEERSLLFLYCWDHKAPECSSCRGHFLLREVVAMDRFGVRLHVRPRCHADLTDSIRVHRYGCAMLPAEGRRWAQAARETARTLVKESH